MNEEEKQAIFEIEKLTAEIYIYMGIEKVRFYRDKYKTILNLIDKQQKEIEELKERNQTCIKESDLMNAVSFLMNRNDMSNYISKDKIREKIKELEKYVNDFEEYWSKDPRQFKKEKCIDYYKLEALKELLGE